MFLILKNKEEFSLDEILGIDIIEMPKFENKMVVILGNFDGVHLGHMELINSAIKYAKERNLKTLLYTFRVLPPKSENVITTLYEKVDFLNTIDGLDYVYIEEFNDVKDLKPEDFCNLILLKKLNAKSIFCGFNFTFGKNKKGTVDYLYKEFSKVFDINVIEPVMYNSLIEKIKVNNIIEDDFNVISSTFIKKLLDEGKLDKVNKLLGHPYFIMGKVVKGKQLARKLGYPTANLCSRNKKYPKYGVYGVKLIIEGYSNVYYGIMNIGKNPTVENEGLHIETHIFDFDDDIYGKKIKVELLFYIRNERKMNSLDELKSQIKEDIKKWRAILK